MVDINRKARASSRPGTMIFCGAALILILWATAPAGARDGLDGRWAILLAGVSGDAQLQRQFVDELRALQSVLTGPMAFPKDHVFVLADDPAVDSSLVQARSTREGLEQVVRRVASRAAEGDLVFVFIEGHGSFDSGVYKLNLVGPDPTARELTVLFDVLPPGRLVIVNATPSSGGSVADLSKPGRILVTATKSGNERNRTRFGPYFVEALRADADADHNGRVSILEAFGYARQKVEESYAAGGNLQTEHAILEDDADGVGHDQPAPDNGEGLVARTTYLDRGTPAGTLTAEQEALSRQAREIERKIEELRYSKSRMAETEYEKQLEELLVKLAEITGRLRKK